MKTQSRHRHHRETATTRPRASRRSQVTKTLTRNRTDKSDKGETRSRRNKSRVASLLPSIDLWSPESDTSSQNPQRPRLHLTNAMLPPQFAPKILGSFESHNKQFEVAIRDLGFPPPNTLFDIKRTMQVGKPEEGLVADLAMRQKEMEAGRRLFLAMQKVKDQGIDIKGFLVYAEGSDAVGKSSTTEPLIEVLRRNFGYQYQVHSFKGPTEEERSQHWLKRFIEGGPLEGSIIKWDRGPAGNAAYAPHSKSELRQMAAELSFAEETLKNNGIYVIKVYLHSTQNKQAAVLGKRIARAFQAQKVPDPKVYQEAFSQLSPNDFVAVSRFPQVHKRFQKFIALTNRETPWKIIESSNRANARIELMDRVAQDLEALARPKKAKSYEASQAVKGFKPQGISELNARFFGRKFFLKRTESSVQDVHKLYSSRLNLRFDEQAVLMEDLRKTQVEKVRDYWGGRARFIGPLAMAGTLILGVVTAVLAPFSPLMLIPLAIGFVIKVGVNYWTLSQNLKHSLMGTAEKTVLRLRRSESIACDGDSNNRERAAEVMPGGRWSRLRSWFSERIQAGIVAKYQKLGFDQEQLDALNARLDESRIAKTKSHWHQRIKFRALTTVATSIASVLIVGVLGTFGWPVVLMAAVCGLISFSIFAVMSYLKVKSGLDAKATQLAAKLARPDQTIPAPSGYLVRKSQKHAEAIYNSFIKQVPDLSEAEMSKLRRDIYKTTSVKSDDNWHGRPLAYTLSPILENSAAAAIGAAFSLNPITLALLGVSAAIDVSSNLFMLYKKLDFTLKASADASLREIMTKRQYAYESAKATVASLF